MNTNKHYENFIVFLAPLINSVGGIAIDLYAPSIPSIGKELSASPAFMQNTITITLIFYAIGQLFFGFMADARGRKPAVVFGLSMFLMGSIMATVSQSLAMLFIARALQGFSIGACQVVARALLVDNIKGPRFTIAITYLSLAFGLGPVIAPYIGGAIEVYLGWRYNFVLYTIYGFIVLVFVLSGLKESLTPENRKKPIQILVGCKNILAHGQFRSSVIILGASFSAFLLWNVIGPYIIQNRLGYSAQYFGTTALGVGICYLSGTLINRFLIKHVAINFLMLSGVLIFLIGVIIIAWSFNEIKLFTVLSGIMLIAFSQGFIFSNAMAHSMSLFPDKAGIAASLQGCLMLIFGSCSSAIASALPLHTNAEIAVIFLVLFIISTMGVLFLMKNHRNYSS